MTFDDRDPDRIDDDPNDAPPEDELTATDPIDPLALLAELAPPADAELFPPAATESDDEFDEDPAADANDDTYALLQVDLDAALAAVAAFDVNLLDDLPVPRPREAAAPILRADMPTYEPIAPYKPALALPRVGGFRAGHPLSLVVGALLIAFGGWLMWALANDAPPDLPTLLAVIGGGMLIILLMAVLTSRRFARGAIFAAAALALVIGVIVSAAHPAGIDGSRAWPLLFAAVGAALILTAGAARPRLGRALLPGALLIAAGGAGLAVLSGALPANLLANARNFVPLAIAVVVFLLLLPLAFRRRA